MCIVVKFNFDWQERLYIWKVNSSLSLFRPFFLVGLFRLGGGVGRGGGGGGKLTRHLGFLDFPKHHKTTKNVSKVTKNVKTYSQEVIFFIKKH